MRGKLLLPRLDFTWRTSCSSLTRKSFPRREKLSPRIELRKSFSVEVRTGGDESEESKLNHTLCWSSSAVVFSATIYDDFIYFVRWEMRQSEQDLTKANIYYLYDVGAYGSVLVTPQFESSIDHRILLALLNPSTTQAPDRKTSHEERQLTASFYNPMTLPKNIPITKG